MIVVIPTNRQIELAYLRPLIEAGARFIIVDDSEGTISLDHPQFSVYNWGDRRRILGPLDDRFPRRNGTCRSFGLLLAWRQADPGEIVLALDDDCRVYHDDFAARAVTALSDMPRPIATCHGRHLNVLDLYDGGPKHLFPRGFPYSARIGYQVADLSAPESRHVSFSLGLWRGAFDVNAIDAIDRDDHTLPDIGLKHESVILAPGKLVSVCSMNMLLRRETIPAAFQLPMNVTVMPGAVIDRYGDIWGGFILKALMDINGEAMAVGEPMIDHLKQGNRLRNAWQENLCHQVNDEFVDLLDQATEELAPGDYTDMMAALSENFRGQASARSPILRAYLATLTDSIDAWTEALAGPARLSRVS